MVSAAELYTYHVMGVTVTCEFQETSLNQYLGLLGETKKLHCRHWLSSLIEMHLAAVGLCLALCCKADVKFPQPMVRVPFDLKKKKKP